MDDAIRQAVEQAAVKGEVACADAHAIAAQQGVLPGQVARVVNKQTSLRFNRCQLGLFGYGVKAEGKSKIVLAATNLPDEIVAAIQARAKDGQIACLATWEIAEQFKYPRLGIGNICQALDLRVKPCQLGCF